MEIVKTALDYIYKNPSILSVQAFVAGYVAYYIIVVVKKPQLACQDKKLRKFITTHCPIVSEKYWPTFWCFESRAQTILTSVIKYSPRIYYESEIVSMPDGGQVLLDWVHNENPRYPDPLTRPTVVILPGLTGSSGASYVLHFVHEATQLGYRSVVFNNRGKGSRLLTERTYSAANTEDLGNVVSHIKGKYPAVPIMGAGISLGGMILFNYLSKMGNDSGMLTGMCVSMAWNIFESIKTIESPGLNKHVINRQCARGLVDSVKENVHLFKPHLEDIDHVLKSTTIREFDDRFTAPMFGYPSIDDYYKDACLHDKIHQLKVPVICLNASDDPFSPHHAIPIDEAEQNDNIAIVVTSHGGHIGFLEGAFPRHASFMDRLFSQYADAVFKHGDMNK